MMKLVKCPNDGKAATVHPMTVRYGLTKFTQQIKRGLKNVGHFLRKLKEDNVIKDETKRQVELAYSLETKVENIILHLTTEANDVDILKASKCLRTMEPNGLLLAALVENTSDDGRNITEQIDEYVKRKVMEILKQSLEKCWNKNVESASLHLYVEKILGQQLDFCIIKDLVVHHFGLDDTQHNSSCFMGLRYKEGVDSSGTGRCPSSSVKREGNERKVNYIDMKTGDFAKYLDEEMCNFSADCKGKFEKAIVKEKISVLFFKDMSEDDMERVFKEYIKPVTLVFGLRKMLSIIQNRIGDQYEEASSEKGSVILRSFGQTTGGLTYRRGFTEPPKGSLLVPRHEYRFLPDGEHYSSAFVAKEVVRFLAAYMNGRQNGTIHFGISKKNEDVGEIIGIPKNCSCYRNLDIEIQSAVQICFKENSAMANPCILPVQQIPVEDDRLVIEVDVEPMYRWLDEGLIPIYFPPKGYQQKEYAVYYGDMYNMLQDTEIESMSSICSKRLEARKHLEMSCQNENVNGSQMENRLKHMLTQGNKYVTSFFTPVIVSGKIKDCNNENEIRQVLDIEYALTSCSMVLDFDTSPILREKVEAVASSFLIKTAENLQQDKNDEIYDKKLWIYCNGYDRSPNEKERRAMDIRKWLSERSDGVRKALGKLRNQVGKGECKMIFLVFQANTGKGRDPMLEIARDSIINNFRGECIVVAENDLVLKDWRKEFQAFIEDFENLFVTGISWNAVSNICRTVFRANPDIACILPCADGGTVVMSNKEKQRFTDIELVSGEECKHESENLGHEQKQKIVIEAQERYYEGKGISWWNFYFKDQVGTRSCFDYHVSKIENMIKKGKKLVEEYTLYHRPAAGGTTLGWHLLWHFSQLSYRPSNVYRCCVLKTFSEDTLDQLADFHCFKERQDPNPFIIMLDSQPDEVLNNFKAK